MFRFLTDENFHGDITRGLWRCEHDLDILRVQDSGLMETDDRIILQHAAEQNRIVLTHDQRTMVPYAYQRAGRGDDMPGVIHVDLNRMSIGESIDELVRFVDRFRPEEIKYRVIFLPSNLR